MDRRETINWLREEDPTRLAELWQAADAARRRNVGEEVHLRALVEFSNCCVRQCAYCGLRADNRALGRYRMSQREILDCAAQAAALGCGTLVLQSGQDEAMAAEWLADVIRQVKRSTPLAVTLSVGERREEELKLWRGAGADRYLLRFETSNPELYARIHPSLACDPGGRIEQLAVLRRLGYEVGSGVMIGIPGQTYEDLARDLEIFAKLELDMIGVGPFLAHPGTPLGQNPPQAAANQVPNTELMTYKMIALTRLACPNANIPATTALATLNIAQGRELGLQRGANVVMPNFTPQKYRAMYEIYPAKACISETAGECCACVRRRVESVGRRVGRGPGGARRPQPTKAGQEL